MDGQSNFNNPNTAMLLLSVLVKRLGGVTITQAEVDDVAYSTLNEDAADGTITLTVTGKELH